MLDDAQEITTYEAMLVITNQMLAAAQNSEWDKLVILEQECKALTDKLVQHSSQNILSHELQQRKIRIIHQVLADDAQIRMITEPWMEKLRSILNTAEHKRNLQQAYQPDHNT
ncbi:flagellar protein FliT [Nitrosomonas cryotolerans]|uniref:Flagellar protein FliT n=1 Tax=Nitrosomonas cryotolerans ATCC 49181 TaxID=1131553 RepID=A0A1N6I6B0_9PROT|nr:flagellar protein FliT [Nitrosomonas cryotolerans]SFP91305.1 flagellar protein FliT [Nitrosomonas cryotolerans]SIO27541.1 flagellar protein FliT [Nitrosomonas cryotolerans ATCC 49181]